MINYELRVSFISLVFILIPLLGYSGEDIDFSSKKITREISRTFEVTGFKMDELHLSDSVINYYHISGKFFKIIDNSGLVGYSYIGRVKSCHNGGCSMTRSSLKNDRFEYFDYFILFDPSLSIKSARVYNYQSTHGYEITAKKWLKQFIGFNGETELKVGKNVDAISGATISVHSITSDIQQKTVLLEELVK